MARRLVHQGQPPFDQAKPTQISRNNITAILRAFKMKLVLTGLVFFVRAFQRKYLSCLMSTSL